MKQNQIDSRWTYGDLSSKINRIYWPCIGFVHFIHNNQHNNTINAHRHSTKCFTFCLAKYRNTKCHDDEFCVPFKLLDASSFWFKLIWPSDNKTV
jgi:hypothetical protein